MLSETKSELPAKEALFLASKNQNDIECTGR